MLRIVLFSFINVLCVHAQSQIDRCEVRRTEGSERFEQWLRSNQISSVIQSSVTYRIPVVVHVLHKGDPLGEGFNFSASRIVSQIKTLNEDFRRKENTPGFNSHPDGGDTRIEFVLAQTDPDGNPTDGIVRVDMSTVQLPPVPPEEAGDVITACTRYSYWNPEQYLNIWCFDAGFPPGLFLGSARFPVTNLPGLDTKSPGGDGIFINALNFGHGDTNTDPDYNMGRSLTHEMGHFLGVLHTFGAVNECGQYTDYCDDTPSISSPTQGCPMVRPQACDGRPAMIENYMDYAYDRCMNIFTHDQIARMHTVLENSPRRASLLTSTVIDRPDVVTDLANNKVQGVKIYPNPATDKLLISIDQQMRDANFKVTAHTLLGKMIYTITGENKIEIPVSEIQECMIIITVEGDQWRYKQFIVIN